VMKLTENVPAGEESPINLTSKVRRVNDEVPQTAKEEGNAQASFDLALG